MAKLSVIIITHNEERNIQACLESVKWADEIIVVDAFSTDRTVDICRGYTDRIFQRSWRGFSEQKQFALEQASHQWVLSLDADERVSEELKGEIQKLLAEDPPWDGFYVPRRSYFLGKWMRHSGWYPGYQLRLFRKDRARLSGARVHEGFLVQGRIGYLKGDLIHHTHRTLEESFHRLNLYSSLEAQDRLPHQGRVRWHDFFTHAFGAFFRKYVMQKGFLDGVHGLILALITAMLKMALYMKIWELQRKVSDSEES